MTELPSDTPRAATWRKRIQRACDVCRRRKVRCDGSKRDIACSNCVEFGFECSYGNPQALQIKLPIPPRRPPSKSLVRQLQKRIAALEAIIRHRCPDIDLTEEFPEDKSLKASLGPSLQTDNISHLASGHPLNSSTSSQECDNPRVSTASLSNLHKRACEVPHSKPSGLDKSFDSRAERAFLKAAPLTALLVDGARLRRISKDFARFCYLGKSCGILLYRHVRECKRETVGTFPKAGRPEFWRPRPWESVTLSPRTTEYSFPGPDLLCTLVCSYFDNVNILLPLLHRPSFERKLYMENLHVFDPAFAAIVMVVCSVGARFLSGADDERVRLDSESSLHSAGWRWFQQVGSNPCKSMFTQPSLSDVQFHVLAAVFLLSSTSPQSAWTIVGTGLRLVQDVGAHRASFYPDEPTDEMEHWRRAVWSLAVMDRMLSAWLGRTPATIEDDFDLPYPLEVDDAYWFNKFEQPKGVPSTVAAFVEHIKLSRLLHLVLSSLYSSKKLQTCDDEIVVELDSGLNRWLEELPPNLRWNADNLNQLFYEQSAFLFHQYHYVRMMIHQLYLRRDSPTRIPSLNMCTNAARSCAHISSSLLLRCGSVHPFSLSPIFISGLVLLLNVWNNQGKNDPQTRLMLMNDALQCMDALKALEKRWSIAGRYWDCLAQFSTLDEMQLVTTARGIISNAASRKTCRNETDPHVIHEFTCIGEDIASNDSSASSAPLPSSLPPDAQIVDGQSPFMAMNAFFQPIELSLLLPNLNMMPALYPQTLTDNDGDFMEGIASVDVESSDTLFDIAPLVRRSDNNDAFYSQSMSLDAAPAACSSNPDGVDSLLSETYRAWVSSEADQQSWF